MASPTDEELMTAVKVGDIAAFEALVERHKGIVYSMAFGMLRSREDAEEAAQDTFVKLFRARDQFDQSRRLEPWLLRIAGNTCRDALRRRRTETLTRAATGAGEHLVNNVPDPRSIGRNFGELGRQSVRDEIGKLSEALRLPLILKYLNGLTNRQVADALGISVSNVKVRMARAKDLLQSRLAEQGEVR